MCRQIQLKEELNKYLNANFNTVNDIEDFIFNINEEVFLKNNKLNDYYSFNIEDYITKHIYSLTEGIKYSNEKILNILNNLDHNFIELYCSFIEAYTSMLLIILDYFKINSFNLELKMNSYLKCNLMYGSTLNLYTGI